MESASPSTASPHSRPVMSMTLGGSSRITSPMLARKLKKLMNLFAATGNIHGNASPAATQSQPDQTETGGGVDETGGPAIHDLGMPHGRGSRRDCAQRHQRGSKQRSRTWVHPELIGCPV